MDRKCSIRADRRNYESHPAAERSLADIIHAHTAHRFCVQLSHVLWVEDTENGILMEKMEKTHSTDAALKPGASPECKY